MIKQRLIKKRKEKGFSQEEMAFKLNIEQPQYSRRENGITKISKKEWDAIAEILNTSIKTIFEPEDDGTYIINNKKANGNFDNHNIFNSYSEELIQTMSKYIEKLEEENRYLKSKN